MLSHLIARLIILIFGTFYPAYACFKVVQAEDRSNYLKWIMYWIVFAIFTCIETIMDLLIWWFPLYYETKLVIVIGVILSLSNDSSTLYRHFACPLLKHRKLEIDECINFVRWKGSRQFIRKTLYLARRLSVGVLHLVVSVEMLYRSISNVLFLCDSFTTQTPAVEVHIADNETNKRFLASSGDKSSYEEKTFDHDHVLKTVIHKTELHTTLSECQRIGIIKERLDDKKRIATAVGNLPKTSSRTTAANASKIEISILNNYNNNEKNEQNSNNIDCIEHYKNIIAIETNEKQPTKNNGSTKIGLLRTPGMKEIETEVDNGTHDMKETIKRAGTLNFENDNINEVEKLDEKKIINKESNITDTFINKKLEENMTITNTNSKINANIKAIKTTNINSVVANNLNSNTNVNVTSRETVATTIDLTSSITKSTDSANEKIEENITITNAETIEASIKNAEEGNLDLNVNANMIPKEAITTRTNVTLSDTKASDTLNEKIEENEKITNPNLKLKTNEQTSKTVNINAEFTNSLNPQINTMAVKEQVTTTANLVCSDANKNDKIAEPPRESSSLKNTTTSVNISTKEVSPVKAKNKSDNGNVNEPQPLTSAPSHGNTIGSTNATKVTTLAPHAEKVPVNCNTRTINNNKTNSVSQNVKNQPVKTTTNTDNMNANNILRPSQPAQKTLLNYNTNNNNNNKANQNIVKTPQPVKNATNSFNTNSKNNVIKPAVSTKKAQDNLTKNISTNSNKCTNVNTPHSNRNNYPSSVIQKVQNRSTTRSRNTMIGGPPEWTLRYYNTNGSTQSSNVCSPSFYCRSPTPTSCGYSYWDHCGYY